MYRKFYHLKENPFNVTADPAFFFSSSCHTEAFSHLIYGIQQRKGILLITGEIGTGKTTLCRTILHSYRNHLENDIKTALILNPSFSDLQLLQLILKDFGIKEKFKNKFDLIDALNKFLLEETSHGHNIVLIVDEAQNLGVEQLEQIRLLSNLETEKQKLLQIILVGQPELCEKLKLPSLRQLNQRIAIRYHILPLERDEMQNYIEHRLRIASSKDSGSSVHFTKEAIDTIYENSEGIPRMVNILCDRALLAGYTLETFTIDECIVHKCVQEVGIKNYVNLHGHQNRKEDIEPRKITVLPTKKRKTWYKSAATISCIFFIIAGLLFAISSDLSDQSPVSKKENVISLKTGQPKSVSEDGEETVLQYAKGYNYDGQGNYKEETIRYRGAAEQGDAQAQFSLGLMYKEGREMKQDYEEAVRWYRKAAEQGHAQAQTNLGLMYSKGWGVGQDYEEAVKWYSKAADQGIDYAKQILKRLE
jgi:general secretion pathway protein A